MLTQMSFLKALVAGVISTLGATQATAQFVLDNSLPKNPYGGTYTVTQGPPPPYRTGSYSSGTNPSSYGKTISGGTVTLSGEVVFKYKWAGAPGAVPQKAYVLVESDAGWHNGSGTDADNGLQDPYVYRPHTGEGVSPTGQSYGIHFQTKDVTNGTFEVKLSPSVHTNGEAILNVRVQVIDVGMTIAGVNETLSSTASQVLVGQHQTATVYASGGYTLKNKAWTVAGPKTFGRVLSGTQHSNTDFPGETYLDSHHYDLPVVIDQPNQDSASFYEAAPGAEKVTCTAGLYDPNGAFVQSVTIARDVSVLVPDYGLTLQAGTTQLIDSGGTVNLFSTGPGMKYTYFAKTPTGFAVSSGGSQNYGLVAIGQLVKSDRAVNPHPPYRHVGWSDYRLDNTFPYNKAKEVSANVNSTAPVEDSDSPGMSFPSAATSAVISDDFYTTCMYLPPGDGVYVPLREKDWSWHATGTKVNTNWAGSGNPVAGPGGGDFDLDKLSWDAAITNSNVPTLP